MHATTDMIPIEVHTTVPKLDETADCNNYVIRHDSNKGYPDYRVETGL